ncbi:isocitrate/isopropylmalate family dehydrogenase [Serratia ureilytica]
MSKNLQDCRYPRGRYRAKCCRKAYGYCRRRRALGSHAGVRHLEWASCDYYQHHGQMMWTHWFEQLKGFDAIYFGAVGWRIRARHISLWVRCRNLRRDFEQYVNLRPVRLFPGVPCPLANKQPGDIDFYVVRENTKGEYSSLAGGCSKAPSAKCDPRNRLTSARAWTVS